MAESMHKHYNSSSYDGSKKKKHIKEVVMDKWQNIWNKQSAKPNEVKREIRRRQNRNIKRNEETVCVGHVTRITRGILMSR